MMRRLQPASVAVLLMMLGCRTEPRVPHEGGAGLTLTQHRVDRAREAVEAFFTCLVGQGATSCRAILDDPDALQPDGQGATPISDGSTWAFLRERRAMLQITGITSTSDLRRLRMRFDVMPHELVALEHLDVVVPDMTELKQCGVMKEVRLPLSWQHNQARYVILGAGVSVNGAQLNLPEALRGSPAFWRRALCPAADLK